MGHLWPRLPGCVLLNSILSSIPCPRIACRPTTQPLAVRPAFGLALSSSDSRIELCSVDGTGRHRKWGSSQVISVAGNLSQGGPVPIGAKKANLSAEVEQYLQEVALNEQVGPHVHAL